MTHYWVIVYKRSKEIANSLLFESIADARDWKKTMIAEGHCLNPIDTYDYVSLDIYTK